MRIETENRVSGGEPERAELSAMKRQQGEGFMDSCTSCLGENGEIPCGDYLECVFQFICGCGERICEFIEDVKDFFSSCIEKICSPAKEDEGLLVTAFIEKWQRIDGSALKETDPGYDEMRTAWRDDVDKLPRIAQRYGDAGFAAAHKTELYADTLERVGMVRNLTNLENAVGSWVEDHIASKEFIAGVARWTLAGSPEQQKMPPVLTDQELCDCFTHYWSTDRFAQKNVKKAWIIGYDLLPEVVKDVVRDAFFANHTEITITVPDTTGQSEGYRRRLVRDAQDPHIRFAVANPTVLQVVREWKAG